MELEQFVHAGRMWTVRSEDNHDKGAIFENWNEDQYDIVDLRPQVVLDIGGNIGSFTLRALAEGAQLVVAVEPEPHNIELFKLNCAQEIEDGRVVLIERAVWSSEMTLRVSDVKGASGTSPEREGADVQSVTLESLLSERQYDFMKMDIEGAEIEALDPCPPDLLSALHGIGLEYHCATIPQWWQTVYKLSTCGFYLEIKAFPGAFNGGMLWGHQP